MKLKQSTIDFIELLLSRELQAEYDCNEDITDNDYAKDLINAIRNFEDVYGNWFLRISTEEDIAKFKTEE